MSIDHLLIGASGMISPIGTGLDMVAASMAAGLNQYELVDIFEEEIDIKMSLVPTVAINQSHGDEAVHGDLTSRQERMLYLANHAITQLAPSLPKSPVPIFLAGPEDYVGLPLVSAELLQNLAIQSNINVDLAASRFVNTGRAGAMDVIELAFKYLAFDDCHVAIVGGVDTFYDYRTIQYLYERYRVYRPGAFDGLIPGEGAGFLLLVSPDAPDELKQNISGYLTRPSMGFEPGHLMGKEDYTAETLAQVFSGALQSAPSTVTQVYSSANSEVHYTKELTVALMRNFGVIDRDCVVHQLTDFLGDLGAAYGLIAVALANRQLEQNSTSIVYCSSDSGPRAALCVGA